MENGVGPEFHPLYTVKVPNASKNGENVEFFVESNLVRIIMFLNVRYNKDTIYLTCNKY